MNIDLKEKALTKAKELYPEASMDQLIINASKLEAYFEMKGQIDSLPVFASNCFVQHPINGNVNFTPYRAQIEALLTIQQHQHTLIHASRQSGSTTLLCMAILWEALRKPHQTIVVMSKSFMQVQELKSRIEYAHYHLMGLYPKMTHYNKALMQFSNGSCIHYRAATDAVLRGLSVDALYIDNAGYISHSILHGIWQSAMPLMANHCRTVLAHSGACVDSGVFYELWQANNTMAKFKLHWSDTPSRDAEWESTMRSNFGNATFNAEFECEFTSK